MIQVSIDILGGTWGSLPMKWRFTSSSHKRRFTNPPMTAYRQLKNGVSQANLNEPYARTLILRVLRGLSIHNVDQEEPILRGKSFSLNPT